MFQGIKELKGHGNSRVPLTMPLLGLQATLLDFPPSAKNRWTVTGRINRTVSKGKWERTEIPDFLYSVTALWHWARCCPTVYMGQLWAVSSPCFGCTHVSLWGFPESLTWNYTLHWVTVDPYFLYISSLLFLLLFLPSSLSFSSSVWMKTISHAHLLP